MPLTKQVDTLPLGRVVATPGALAALEQDPTAGPRLVKRHASGDWGELDADDWKANERAVALGERVLSAYTLATGVKLWVITEADRASTCFLLPEEY